MAGCRGQLELTPVASYRRVRYPTREEARALGIDLYRVPESAILKYGRGTIAGATLLMLNTSCVTQGIIAEHIMNEYQARDYIVDMLTAQGLTLRQDTRYTAPDVEFQADGFDETLGIGFEYHSPEDATYSDGLMGTPDWDMLFLDEEETDLVMDAMDGGGDAFLLMDTGEAEEVRVQVEEFIEWLRNHGRL